MDPKVELATLLRPAGAGIYLVSAGREEQLALQRRLYDAEDERGVRAKFEAAIDRLTDSETRIAMMAVPSDVGAGFRRGANLGPQALRMGLLDQKRPWHEEAAFFGIVDLGDVFVVPQLLTDDMLSEAQLAKCRRAVYPDLSPADRDALPVSPLSIAERAWDLVFGLAPHIAPVVLGGDHSTAYPAVAALSRIRNDFGIVQPDAHTDLLEERMGIRLCFATWSFHANRLIGGGGKLVQVGIRQTRFPRSHWESTQDVRQFWADECVSDPEGTIAAIIAHLRQTGVRGVYFSNDIDGTDERFVDATGTPETGGVTPAFIEALIDALGEQIGLVGGDVMELAPLLGERADSRERTVNIATSYLRRTLRAILNSFPGATSTIRLRIAHSTEIFDRGDREIGIGRHGRLDRGHQREHPLVLPRFADDLDTDRQAQAGFVDRGRHLRKPALRGGAHRLFGSHAQHGDTPRGQLRQVEEHREAPRDSKILALPVRERGRGERRREERVELLFGQEREQTGAVAPNLVGEFPQLRDRFAPQTRNQGGRGRIARQPREVHDRPARSLGQASRPPQRREHRIDLATFQNRADGIARVCAQRREIREHHVLGVGQFHRDDLVASRPQRLGSPSKRATERRRGGEQDAGAIIDETDATGAGQSIA
jgi:arginase family enzyme